MKHTIEVPVYIHDTTQNIKEVHDSTYIDRWHTIEVKGDTVYCHDSIVFIKYHVNTDTAYKYVEKPVEVNIEHTREVKMPMKWWEKGLMWSGVAGLLSVLGAVVWKTRKIWLRLIAI